MKSRNEGRGSVALRLGAVLAVWLCLGLKAMGDEDHAAADLFAAEVAALLPQEEVIPPAQAVAPQDRNEKGEWGGVIDWPHVAVSAANLPDGRVLTFASNRRTSFPVGPEFTYAAVYDPSNGSITEINHDSHDMFCGHLVMLLDGRPFINGGRNTVPLTSYFDYENDRWVRSDNMNDGRWYPTTTMLSNGEVFTASGSGGTNTTEVWKEGAGWRRLSNINWSSIAGAQGFESNWWPYNFVAPNGRIFHAGPTDRMHWVDPTGNGQLTQASTTVPGTYYPKHAGVAMYDEGMLIVAGGAATTSGGTSNAVYTVDLNGDEPVVTVRNSMAYPRRFQNALMLPNGKVIIVGGNTSGQKFSDNGTVYIPEVWDPNSDTWEEMAPMGIPRNYHSVALLLPDGRIFSAGSGLAGNASVDHDDAQIYSPPYLFDSNGQPAVRPQITNAPDVARVGQVIPVTATPGVSRFTMIRMTATTHGLSTDLRFLDVPFVANGGNSYDLDLHDNPNVLIGGYWMLFALDAQGVPSIAKTFMVSPGNRPSIAEVATQNHALGESISMAIQAEDADQDALNYAANGLPTGLEINSATGEITGTLAEQGTFNATVTVDDSLDGPTSTDFTWNVIEAGSAPINGLGGYWNFEIDGTPVIGFAPASFQNGVQIVSDPDRGNVLQFDGINDLVDLPLNLSERQATISFWFKTSKANGGMSTLAEGPLGQRGNDRDLYFTGGDLNARLFDTEVITSSGVNYADGQWHNVVYTYGPSSDEVYTPGLDYEYFEGEWSLLPNFDALSHVAAGTVSTFTLTPKLKNDLYAFRFKGRILIETAGTYTFFTDSDDGSQLLINGDLVVDNDGLHASREISNQIQLDPGYHQIEVTFFEKFGGDSLIVSYQGPGIPKQQIPADKLFRGGGQRLFIDGVEVAQGSKPTSNLDSQDRLLLGFSNAGNPQYFEGFIDNLRIYTRALTQFEAAQIALNDSSEPISSQSPPEVVNPGNQINLVGDTVNLAITATDAEDDTLTYGATGLPAGLEIDSASGVISGEATAEADTTVLVTVSDGTDSSNISFNWVVRGELSLPPVTVSPQQSGADATYSIQTPPGAVSFQWNFGDGSPLVTTATGTASHQFSSPGRFTVTVVVTDDAGQTTSFSFKQAVYGQLGPNAPAVSQPIVYEAATDRIWNVNPDNDTVSVSDALMNTKLQEIIVGEQPRALAVVGSEVWVACKGADKIDIIDAASLSVVRSMALPVGSRPHGIAKSPAEDVVYVVLEESQKLYKVNAANDSVVDVTDLGPNPRHISVSGDGAKVYVTRFVTPVMPGEASGSANPGALGGEVLVINSTTLDVEDTIYLTNNTTPDAANAARGIPNYLGPAALSPDGLSAWVASKQDNIQRGGLRDGNDLTHDSSVRSISSYIDLVSGQEILANRIDHDNAGIAVTSAYGPYGNFIYVALEGSRHVAIIDAYSFAEIKRFKSGRAPQGVSLSPDGTRLFVHNFMERTVTVHDVSQIVNGTGEDVPKLATISVVAAEKLTAQVLTGKQHFYDAQDVRLALQEYISCASCHNDGGHDGRIWDLTGFGEGLRNTGDLRGKGGTDHGPLHWSGNFDEVHDFEVQIRNLSGGQGLLSDSQFSQTQDPLGAPKAGISPDLDALAAYVGSLKEAGRSPYRNQDGSLTSLALQGREVFKQADCASCHSGTNFTDSAPNVSHDIGTLRASSGNRLGGLLNGLDTPTLRGVWSTAPYLHDGSAPTLKAAIQAHQGISLSNAELDQLVEYLKQIDDQELEAPQADPDPDPEPNPVPVDPNLMARLGFDETSGTVSTDLSGNENDGSLVNNVAFVPGLSGNAVHTGGDRDHIKVNHNEQLNLGANGGDFTLAFWVNLDEGPNGKWRGLAKKGNRGSERAFVFYLYPDNNRLEYGATTATRSKQLNESEGSLKVNDWTHVTLVKAGSQMTLYMDGAFDSSFTLSSAFQPNTGDIYLGDTPDEAQDSVRALFDDLRIYNVALTPARIAELPAALDEPGAGQGGGDPGDGDPGDGDPGDGDPGDGDPGGGGPPPPAPDTTSPTLLLSTADAVVDGPFAVACEFDEPVTGLGIADITVTNGVVTSLQGAGNSYLLNIAPDTAGPVTIEVPAGSASDAAGNGNVASNLLEVTYDDGATGETNDPDVWIQFIENGGQTASDSSGNGHNATLTGGTAIVAGRVGNGAESSGNRDSIAIDHAPSLNIGANDGDYTVAFWIKLTENFNDKWRGLIKKGDIYDDRDFIMTLYPDNNTVEYGAGTTFAVKELTESSAELPLNTWTHLTLVKRGRDLELYFNGALDSSYTLQGATLGNTGKFYFGDAPNAGQDSTQAVFDEIRIYTQALTPQEIEQLSQP